MVLHYCNVCGLLGVTHILHMNAHHMLLYTVVFQLTDQDLGAAIFSQTLLAQLNFFVTVILCTYKRKYW